MRANGGVKAFLDDNKKLLDLEKTVSKAPSAKADEGRGHREKFKGTEDDFKKDILEDPNAAAKKNWEVFNRKFDAQKDGIADALTLAVQREGDRVVRELKGSAHERIRDQVRFLRTVLLVLRS